MSNEFLRNYHDLLGVLRTAQKRRKILNGIEWIEFERTTMVDHTNLLRARSGKGPVSVDVVRAKEDLAAGHSDYTQKFAIGCAELVSQ